MAEDIVSELSNNAKLFFLFINSSDTASLRSSLI